MEPVVLGTGLRCCYVMRGTDVVYRAICLRAYYAMRGTDVAYGATLADTGRESAREWWLLAAMQVRLPLFMVTMLLFMVTMLLFMVAMLLFKVTMLLCMVLAGR
eukprot:3211716-Rhodomonas_salina.1